MKTNIATLQCIAFFTLAVGACYQPYPPPSPSSSGSTANMNGSTSSDCLGRCARKATSCGVDKAQADDACANQLCNYAPTDAQLSCFESTGCDVLSSAIDTCGIGASGGGGSGGGGGGGGGGACIPIGGTGCSVVLPNGCCTDSARPNVACFSNADQSLQCCVNLGQPCTQSSDCCGFKDSGGYYKCCPTGVCGANC